MNVVALVPCRNGAGSVGAAVRALIADNAINTVVVIDDSSRDETTNEALAAGAKVVRLQENRGKGGAIAAGINATREADVYLLVDADTASSAGLASTLLAPVLHNQADLVIGVLPAAGKRGGFGFIKRFAAWGIERACGYQPSAPLSGQRAVRADLLRSMNLASRYGLEVGMTIDAVRANARLLEQPVEMDHHHRGRKLAGFIHRGKQGLDIARAFTPRLLSQSMRLGLLGLATVVALCLVFLSASHSSMPKSRPLPTAQNVRIVLVDTTWKDPPVGIEQVAGSVAAGDLDDVMHVIKSGSRDKSAQPIPQVQVEYAKDNPQLNPQEVVIVTGFNSQNAKAELEPLTVWGANVTGTLTSTSTKRKGLVDITDLAPTVLEMQGLPIPSSVTGNAIRVIEGKPAVAQLADEAKFAAVSDEHKLKVIPTYVVLQLIIYLTILAKFRKPQKSWLLIASTIAAFPLATYLVRWLDTSGGMNIWAWSATCAVIMGMIVGMCLLTAQNSLTVLSRLLLATIALIVGDLLTGGHLQIAGLFGSSPALGTRYNGIGNPASALLLTASIFWWALHIQQSINKNMAFIRGLLVFTVVAATVATPGVGSDVGGLIAFAFTGALFSLLATGYKLSLKLIGVIAGLAALLVVIAGWLDSLRQASSRSHLGDLFVRVLNEGLSPLWEIVSRKVEVNLFGYGFPWSLAVVAAGLATLYLLSAKGSFNLALPTGSIERYAAIAACAGSLVSFAVNDSGVVVIALLFVFLGPYLLVQHYKHQISTHELEVLTP